MAHVLNSYFLPLLVAEPGHWLRVDFLAPSNDKTPSPASN